MRNYKNIENKHIKAGHHGLKLAVVLLLMLCMLLPTLTAFAVESEDPIRVGWVVLPGLQSYEDGVYSGYTYDYLMKVADYTGWTYEFVPGTLADILAQLERGDVDVVGGLLYSEERAALFDIPQSEYGHSYLTLFTSLNSTLAENDFESFDGISVGVIENATVNIDEFRIYANENGFSYSEVIYPDNTSVMNAVISGEVDAGMHGAYQANENAKVLAEFSPKPIYFAVTKGNDAVVLGLNRAINQIKIDNPYLEIELYQKYFAIKSNRLTDAELAVVEESAKTPVTVGVVDNSAPLFYYDKDDGKYAGITIDILNLISERTGLKFEYVPADISRSSEATNPTATSPKIVVGVASMDSVSVERDWHLSNALVNDTLVLVGKSGTNIMENPSQKKLALMNNFNVADSYVATYLPEYQVAKYDDIEACLNAVAKGEADAAVYVRSSVSYLLQKPYFENLEIINAYSDSINLVVAAFTEENEPLINIINKGLAVISEEESVSITLDHTVVNPYKLTLRDTVYKYRVLLILVAILVIAIIGVLIVLYGYRRKSSIALQKAYDNEKLALATAKELAAKAEQSAIEAKEASAAKGAFMSRMSHEIRTPLNAIIGYNTLAGNDITEARTEAELRHSAMKVSDCLNKSNIASKHLLTIINDVLDMSAIESGKIKIAHERFDFKGLINSLTAIFYSQAKSKGVELLVTFDNPTDEWLTGDQMRTSQVLTNLLSNAIKFTQDGGTVRLSICQTKIENDATHIHFEVSDTGIGMSLEYIEHIWAPFEQADSTISRRFGGTGLGLSITKNLVDLMGGTISVESKLGQGSTFKVDLSYEHAEQPHKSGSYDFSKVNALVVDDDASTCDYIQLLMNRFNARCVTVTSGADAIEAVKLAEDNNEQYTLCLVDWRMPRMDGIETVKCLREVAGDDLPIIVLTAYDFSDIADKAADIGITKFLSKPLFQSSLFDLLANISHIETTDHVHLPVDSICFHGERVLLAEDNVMNMEIARRILESVGLEVDSAWNGQEAVNLFNSSAKGTFSAILMDVQMPVMDGYLATQTIRASEHPDAKSIPIIAMTADAFAENVKAAIESGMNEHIAKPIDVHILFETLDKYINKKN